MATGDDVVTATYVGTSDPATDSASATAGTQDLTGGADATHTTASQIITFTDVPVEGRILSVGDLKIGFWDSSSGNYSNEADAIQKLGVDSVIDLAGKNSADDVAAAVRSLALTGKNVTIDTSYTTTGQVKFEAATAGPEGNFIKSEFYSGTEDFQSTMQIGANTGQSFRVDIKDMRAISLGVSTDHNGLPRTIVVDGKEYQVKWTQNKTVTNGTDAVGIEFSLDVSTHENATAAIGVIDEAINAVSTERSKLGAMQNRLEHTIANLNVSGENLQAAESRIRDVDMAAEMMTFTKYQILQQASTAMLAQANLAPQSVLQLLG
ncbi:MAG: flagellin [Limnochordia bacterium]